MIIICKTNSNEISLNFNSMYLVLWITLYSFLKWIYTLWSEDGLKQRPKHVVNLNKQKQKKTELCCDLLKNPLLQGFVRCRRFRNRSHFQGQDVEEESLLLGRLDAEYGTENLSRKSLKTKLRYTTTPNNEESFVLPVVWEEARKAGTYLSNYTT